ncbi:MAG: hypothetical protein ACTSO5_02755 [Candidatus Heimdallarchaeaceae archaeon]
MKKKILKTALILVTLLILATSIKANSPSSIDLSYDYDIKILDVKVFHSVADANTHYIETMEIYVNDVLNISQGFTNQNTTSYLEVSFSISVDYGDTIKVTAICNIAGSITDQTVVQTPTSPPNTETSDASSIILLGVSMLALVLVVGIKKR